jgi:3-oxoacyl-[acyl-carrier-protein] synthase-3
MHSMGLDFSTRGRNVTVIFGDGAGAVVLQPTEEEGQGVLGSCLHSDGTYAEKLSFITPGAHGGYHSEHEDEQRDYNFSDAEYGEMFLNEHMVREGQIFPYMDGPFVFKMAVKKFPAVIMEVLAKTGHSKEDIDMFIPHQANLRISQFVQRQLGLTDDKIWNNIQKYGNTTAASIPIALSEAVEAGAVKRGDLVCLAAFGSGFTWGSTLLRW